MHRKTLAILLLAACGGDPDTTTTPDAPVTPPAPDAPPASKCTTTPTALRTDLAWYGDNRATLTKWLDSAGCASDGFDPAHPPVITLDWDNTISKNDFGDAMTYWFIAKGKVLQPPGQDWHQTSPYLTDAAVAALATACGTTVAAGQPFPVPSATNHDCADEILSIYDNETTRAGAAAFKAANGRRIEPAFAWTPQLMAGYSHAEVAQATTDMMAVELAAAMDATQTIGTTVENGWLRIYDQQKDLIAAMHSRGYAVWIITASPQDVIATAAAMVDIPADHVIGIRSMTDGAGKLTYKFEGCGTYPDNQQDLIPYIHGKRCFINKVAYGETGAAAMQRRPDGQRPVFAAGDSDSDVEFLRDATYKLAINRQKADLMCHAYYNENDSWRVNPMFIEPKTAKSGSYSCGAAFTPETGANEGTRDEGGNLIPDQADSVHG